MKHRERPLRALRAYGEAEALPTAVVAKNFARPPRDIFTSDLAEICSRGDPCPTDGRIWGFKIKV